MVILVIILATSLVLLLLGVVVSMFFHNRQQKQPPHLAVLSPQVVSDVRLLKKRIQVQEQSFRTIAREIHDNIGLSLTLAKLYLNTLGTEQAGTRQEKVEASVDLITEAITNLRDISSSVNPDIQLVEGFHHALEKEINRIKELGLHKVEYNLIGQPIDLSIQQQLDLFRIIQEALNNIIKHAGASTIRIDVEYSPDSLQVMITDNGKGIRLDGTSPRNGAGLINMQNRAGSLNGSFNIGPMPEGGTRVRIIIPY